LASFLFFRRKNWLIKIVANIVYLARIFLSSYQQIISKVTKFAVTHFYYVRVKIWVKWAKGSFLEITRPGRGVDHPPSSGPDFKNE
jgi:hypothetical protein